MVIMEESRTGRVRDVGGGREREREGKVITLYKSLTVDKTKSSE